MKKKSFIVVKPPHGWLQVGQMPFGRTLTYDLIYRGELDSAIVGKVGTRRGRRLISAESLNRYLQKLAAEQKKGADV